MEIKKSHQNESVSEAANVNELEHDSRRTAVRPLATDNHAVGAQVIGALAIGAMALAVVAIWRLAISQLFVRKSKFVTLEINELSIKRLRVDELVVTENLILPDSGVGKKIAVSRKKHSSSSK